MSLAIKERKHKYWSGLAVCLSVSLFLVLWMLWYCDNPHEILFSHCISLAGNKHLSNNLLSVHHHFVKNSWNLPVALCCSCQLFCFFLYGKAKSFLLAVLFYSCSISFITHFMTTADLCNNRHVVDMNKKQPGHLCK